MVPDYTKLMVLLGSCVNICNKTLTHFAIPIIYIRFLEQCPVHKKLTIHVIYDYYTLTLWPSSSQIYKERKAFLFTLDIEKFSLSTNQSEYLLFPLSCKSFRKCKEVVTESWGFGVQQLMGDLKKPFKLALSSLN